MVARIATLFDVLLPNIPPTWTIGIERGMVWAADCAEDLGPFQYSLTATITDDEGKKPSSRKPTAPWNKPAGQATVRVLINPASWANYACGDEEIEEKGKGRVIIRFAGTWVRAGSTVPGMPCGDSVVFLLGEWELQVGSYGPKYLAKSRPGTLDAEPGERQGESHSPVVRSELVAVSGAPFLVQRVRALLDLKALEALLPVVPPLSDGTDKPR